MTVERHRFSELLAALAGDESRERISIRDIFEVMGERAFGALMLIFALPNVVPTPPGTSAVLGAPLVFLSAQLLLGRQPWLPDFVARRSLSRKDFAAIVARLMPWLGRAERLLKERLTFLTHGLADRLIGAVCLMLSVILALPIPLGNMLPALAICFFSFGILERDGFFVLLGHALAAISVFVVGGVIYAVFRAVVFFVTTSLG